MSKKCSDIPGRWRIGLALAALSLAVGLSLNLSVATAGEVTIIHAGKLLAVPGQAAISPGTLVIEDGKVKEVRAGTLDAAALGIAGDVKVIDLSKQFVMPGFIDLHVHLSSDPDHRGEELKKPLSYFALLGAANAKKTLMGGFTTVRDLGSRGDTLYALRDAIKEGLVPGPKVIASGPPIGPTGGHSDMHGYRSEILDTFHEPNICNGADDCRRAVRDAVKRGADVIKVMVTGGVMDLSTAGTGQQMTDEELKAIADTAHALGRKVTAHAHGKAGIDAAVKAGFDSIEHAMWADEGSMKLFKKYGAAIVPTIYPITWVGDTPEKVMKGPFRNLPPEMLAKLLKLGKQPKIMAALAYKSGVTIALGTDSGVCPHGLNAHEFIEYVGIGMTPMEALMAGTVTAAKVGGFDNVGHLAPGMAADVVAMPESPLDDINAVLKVDFVMRDGIIFKEKGVR